MAYDVADGAGRYVGEFLGSRDDDRLYLRGEAAVGIGDGAFLLEIEHIAYAADDVGYAEIAAHINRKPIVFNNLHAVKPVCGLTYDIHSLLVCVESSLVLVHTNCNHYGIKHSEGALENIEVPCGERVEGSGE